MEQSQAKPSLEILRVGSEKGLVVALSLLILTQPLICLRQVDVGLGRGRIQLQDLVESVDGVLIPALLEMDHAQEMPGNGILRIDFQRPAQVLAGRLYLSLSESDLGAHLEPPGTLGLQLDEGVEMTDRLIQFFLLQVDHGQVVPGGSEGGRDLDCFLEEFRLAAGVLIGGPDEFLSLPEPFHGALVDLGAL